MSIVPTLLVGSTVLQQYLVDKSTGLPLAGGVITLYQDNNRTTLKNWYYQTGSPPNYSYLPLPNPLTLSAVGTIQDPNGNDTLPFYYPFSEQDSTVVQTYYITVDNSLGTRQFTRQNFPYTPGGQNGATGVLTEQNYVFNNQFWRNIGSVVYSSANHPPNQITINSINYFYGTLAPSQHEGLTMPDLIFMKNNNLATDTISFTKFVQGTQLTGDICPEYYINHVSTATTGETLKVYQFPISLHVKTLDLVNATFTIQAQNVPGAANGQLFIYAYQYLGSGVTSMSPILLNNGQPITLSNVWQKYIIPFTFLTSANEVLSSAGDDAWYIQIGIPLNAACNINFTLPSLFLCEPAQIPSNWFTTYDQVSSIVNTPRTGDVRTSMNSFYPFGWVPMNDGTIGDPSSNATDRANQDTWQLFNLLWNAFSPYGSSMFPIYDDMGVISTYSISAIADWNLNKALALTKLMGKVILGTVPVSALLPALPAIAGYTSTVTGSTSSGTLLITSASSNLLSLFLGAPISFTNTGGALPGGLAVNTAYYAVPQSATTLFVATSFANALAGTYVAWSTNGTGTTTLNYAMAASGEGEYSHLQLNSEVATHTHNPLVGTGFWMNGTNQSIAGTNSFAIQSAATTGGITRTGSQTAGNVTQPGTFFNIFIKL